MHLKVLVKILEELEKSQEKSVAVSNETTKILRSSYPGLMRMKHLTLKSHS